MVAATALVDDNFNNQQAGAKPDGYTIEETGGKVSIAEVPSAADKSLYLDDPGATVIKVSKKFAPQTGVVTAELKYMQPTKISSTAKVIRLLDEAGAVAVQVETRSGGLISWKMPDGQFTEIGEYAADTWFTIKVVANVKTQTADVFFNGAQKLTGVVFTAAAANIAVFESYTPGTSARGQYIDNIKISRGIRQSRQSTAVGIFSPALQGGICLM